MTKKRDKKTTVRDLEQVRRKQNLDFFSDCCHQRQIAKINILFFSKHLAYRLVYSKMNLGKKLSHFERFNCLDTVITYHKTKITTSNASLSTDQALLLCSLHSEVWSCNGKENSSKSTCRQLL